MADEQQEAKGLKEIPASEILAKIEKGKPVEYDHVIIKDALDIRKLDSLRYDKIFLIKSPIKITNSIFNENVDFTLTVFKEDFVFSGSQLIGFASFTRAYFTKSAFFSAVHFRKTAEFTDTHFKGYTSFGSAEFNWNAYFNNALFSRKSYFSDVLFIGDAFFGKSTFNESTQFIKTEFREVAYFSNALFNENAWFWKARFNGDALTFRDARFKYPSDQEDACRKAKNVLERNGDRQEAGYHFYREMEAKRKQKGIKGKNRTDTLNKLFDSVKAGNRSNIKRFIIYDVLDFILFQKVFGYGVYPIWLWAWWFFFVGIFAAIYWIGEGVNGASQPLDYIWFSITVAVTPGFAGYRPTPGLYQFVAGFEAILGTFMWAAFIATFARKYMR